MKKNKKSKTKQEKRAVRENLFGAAYGGTFTILSDRRRSSGSPAPL